MSGLDTGEFYATACAVLWAVAVILFRRSGDSVTPVALNTFKNTVGLGLLLVTLPLVGASYVPAEATATDWLLLLGSGVIGIAIADSIFFASLNLLGAGRSAIVDCLYSPFVIAFSFFFLAEDAHSGVLGGMGLMVGAILLTGGAEKEANAGSSPADTDPSALRRGVLYGIVAMILMAAGIVMAKPALNHSDPWWATTVRLLGGVLALAVQSTHRRHRAAVAAAFRPSRTWCVTIPAAVVGAYLAMIMWIFGMTYTDVSHAAVLNQLSTVLVPVLGVIFLKETATWRMAVAVCLGVAGGLMVAL